MEQKLTEVVNKDQKIIVSGKREFNWQDAKEWGMNALKYSSPVLLMILLALQSGKTWEEISIAVYGLILQNAINIVTKWSGEARYVVDKK